MKESNTFIFHTAFIFIMANLVQLLFGYIEMQTLFFEINIKYEILYLFIALLWGVNIYIEFSNEFSKALCVVVRMILHFVLGYFAMLVGFITFFGMDAVKTMFLLTTIIYIASFVMFGYITSSLVKKMSYKNTN